MPRFSVLLPTRGRPGWVPHAVRSVIDQSFQDWELIVLDNSDTPYFERSPWQDRRVRYVWERRAGIADASTRTIELATGDILVPLGDDDRLPPDALEVSERAFFQSDAEWLCGKTLIHDPDGRVIAERGGTPESLHITRNGTYWLGGAVHWRRTLTDRLGGYRPEFEGAADYHLYLRFIHEAPVVITDHVMYLYLDWPGTDSRTQSGRQQEATARIAHGG